MLSPIVFVLILSSFAGSSNGAAIHVGSGNVVNKMVVPRGMTRQEYVKSIADYWTPERRASAKPMEPMIVDRSAVPVVRDHEEAGVETILTTSTFPKGLRAASPTAAGKVFLTMNGDNYVCSGSVVNSRNRDMIVTAGHCVFDTATLEWATDWFFVPGYDSGEYPYGGYVWRDMIAKEQWTSGKDYNFDVAIVLVEVNEQREHILDVVGGFGISLNPARQADTNAFGYPVNKNDGQTMSTCASRSTTPSLLLNANFKGLQITCDMTGGSSGGPWLHNYNSGTLSGQQVSVTSFSYLFAPGKIHGPLFNENNIGSIYNLFQDQ